MIKITKNNNVVAPDVCWNNIPGKVDVSIELKDEVDMDVSHPVASIRCVRSGKDLVWNEKTHDQVALFTQVFMLARRVGWIR